MTHYRAARLPANPGPAAWNAILPPQPPSKPLHGEAAADIAIIGAGFAGLSAARRLLQIDARLNIAVLDAERIAEGAAGRNSGFMIDLPHHLSSDNYASQDLAQDRATITLNRLAIAFGADAAAEYALPQAFFNPAGKINAAASPKGQRHNQHYAQHLERLGEPHEWLDAAAMRAITGSDYYLGGLYTPGAVMLQPAGYIRGLAAGLGNRIQLYENSGVTACSRHGRGWRLHTAAGGHLTAERIILANNGHAASFGFFQRRLLHIFTYAAMTPALDAETVRALGGEPLWAATPADPMGATLRRISGPGGDRLLIRSQVTYNPSMRANPRQLAAIGRRHDAAFGRRFPQIKGINMAYRWAGLLCLSRNGAWAFGEVDDGIVAACCQNGLGTTNGTLAGIAAAERTLGVASDIHTALSNAPQPTPLPPEPLTWLGANAIIRYKTRLAGREQ